MLCHSMWLLLLLLLQKVQCRRCIMYLTGQHDVVPELAIVQDVTHVIMAFMQSSAFNIPDATEWPLFSTVQQVRSKFSSETAVMVAIGGWGDTDGFSTAAATSSSRKIFAKNIRQMVEQTGADGVDIDWEYPGGNGEDYRRVPNSQKAWEVEAYPELLAEIRRALGPHKLISAAVPGLERDMIAFREENIRKLNKSLDFMNIMTYDLMNRRDIVTKHHTGVQATLKGLEAYIENGLDSGKVNVGFAFYVKWFKTNAKDSSHCAAQKGIGCKTALLEDPETGDDLGQSGSFSWHDKVPQELENSFNNALIEGKYDGVGGGHYFWDNKEKIFWTWDNADAIDRKFPSIIDKYDIGGVFAWGLGEDAPKFNHLKALTCALRRSSNSSNSLVTDNFPLKDSQLKDEL